MSELAEAAARSNREESAQQLQDFSARMQQQLADLTRAIQLNLAEVRTTLQGQLSALQQGNETKLDQMRATVEEKLQSTLEARLGESFKLVSDRLEQVHRGLGEMQTLAAGVGDLKRVLTNVKSRGGYGEVQLAALLEQLLTRDQFAVNVATRPNSDRTRGVCNQAAGPRRRRPCWLPIDAKFPVEDYERLQLAQDRADAAAIDEAGRALETRVKLEARRIHEKYVEPPHTTDFALLFLATEGLYAEVLRRPGLVESLQREYRVVVTGPTTLSAMLNSLQMGFRTLVLEKRSAEVWQVLGAVKTEFGKFGDVLGKLKTQLQTRVQYDRRRRDAHPPDEPRPACRRSAAGRAGGAVAAAGAQRRRLIPRRARPTRCGRPSRPGDSPRPRGGYETDAKPRIRSVEVRPCSPGPDSSINSERRSREQTFPSPSPAPAGALAARRSCGCGRLCRCIRQRQHRRVRIQHRQPRPHGPLGQHASLSTYGWRVEQRDDLIGNNRLYDEGTYSFDRGDMVAERIDGSPNSTSSSRSASAAASAPNRGTTPPTARTDSPIPRFATIASYVNNQYSDYTKRPVPRPRRRIP